MKAFSIRLPDDVAKWIRAKAARETIKQDKTISINQMVIDILAQARESDKKKGEMQ